MPHETPRRDIGARIVPAEVGQRTEEGFWMVYKRRERRGSWFSATGKSRVLPYCLEQLSAPRAPRTNRCKSACNFESRKTRKSPRSRAERRLTPACRCLLHISLRKFHGIPPSPYFSHSTAWEADKSRRSLRRAFCVRTFAEIDRDSGD